MKCEAQNFIFSQDLLLMSGTYVNKRMTIVIMVVIS